MKRFVVGNGLSDAEGYETLDEEWTLGQRYRIDCQSKHIARSLRSKSL